MADRNRRTVLALQGGRQEHRPGSSCCSHLDAGLVGWLAYRRGRLYCNTVCPVGALLSLVSRYSLVRIAIDEGDCKGCGLCEKVCKAECIDRKLKTVDFDRCVGCFNCFDVCPRDGMTFSTPWNRGKLTVSSLPSPGVARSSAPIRCRYPRTNGVGRSSLGPCSRLPPGRACRRQRRNRSSARRRVRSPNNGPVRSRPRVRGALSILRLPAQHVTSA